VTRYSHPIEAEVLWASPEMRLRHPAEDPKTLSVNRYDEGNGCGYENGSPDAYVERWVEVGTGAADVLTWFVERFLGLGWTLVEPVPTSGVANVQFRRDPDERAGVLLQGFGEWWRHSDRDVNWLDGVNSMRVHLAVDGVFADGSTGFRVG